MAKRDFTFPAAVAALLIFTQSSSSFAAAKLSCQSFFGEGASIEMLLTDAEHIGGGAASSDAASQSRFKLIDLMGAEDSLSLFGPEFKTWPLLLGVSPDGHLILAKPEAKGEATTIMSVKRLDKVTADYLNNLDLDIAVFVQEKQAPPEYESVKNWLARTEGAFNRAIIDFRKKNDRWVTADSNFDQLSWAVRTNGFIGSLKKPWIIRSTKVYTPSKDGKSATMSAPAEIAPLVRLLLNAK